MYELIIPGVMLVAGSFIDIRKKTLPIWLPIAGGIAGCVFSVVTGVLKPSQSIAGLALGLAILGFSVLSKGGIGAGDALVFMAVGASVGIWRGLFLMWSSFLAAGLVGLMILLIFHKGRRYEIPFLPFLTVAFGLMTFMEVIR